LYLRPRTATILGTYKCNAACKDCCFESSPATEGRLPLVAITDFIDQVADLGSAKVVVFSGGECFLLGRDLVHAVGHAKRRGLATRCVTNGYWAKYVDRGEHTLAPLIDAGLDELNVSTGDFHQQYVSEETVLNAVELALRLGIRRTLLVLELRDNGRVTGEALLRNNRASRLLQEFGTDRFGIVQSPWMPFDVRLRSEQADSQLLSRASVASRGGCRSILSSAVLTPSGRLGVCCGLTRERIPELNLTLAGRGLEAALEEAGRDFLKIWLFVDGPERILAWAASKDPAIQWEHRYAHHCHACLALFDEERIRAVIAAHYRERVDDVLLRYSVRLREAELAEGAVYG
jgi:hypothetical protein